MTNQAATTAILAGATAPSLAMSRHVLCQIMHTIGARAAESGGILLGPIGQSRVSDFYFDHGGSCTASTYAPDFATLQRKMNQEWMPSGIDMKGFAHSHPGGEWLSEGDLAYIRRLLSINPDMALFAAPIVIPHAFRIRPIVVMAGDPSVQVPTKLRLF